MGVLAPKLALSRAEIEAEIATRTWFHTFDLGDGLRTPGYDKTLEKLEFLHLPETLSGQRVLDIGAYDGLFSFECERRGAAEVVAADKWSWEWPGSDARRNFDWMRELLCSSVADRVVAVEDLAPATVGEPYDLVLFLGVLYHAPDPLGYLKRVRSVTKGTVILETLVDLLDLEVPAMAYYSEASLNGDASNHFGPNVAAVEGLLHDAGFRSVKHFEPWSVNRSWALHLNDNRPRSLRRKVRERLDRRARSGRMVFHATV
ncbi:MAG: class I SAM-dependent methyltransferase [Acidimicrobiales bacterium]